MRKNMQPGSQSENRTLRPGLTRRLPARQEKLLALRDQPALRAPLAANTANQDIVIETGAVPATRSSQASIWAAVIIIVSTAIWGLGLVVGFQTALAIQMVFGLILAAAGLFISPSLGLLAISMLCALDAVAADLLLTGGLLRFNTLNYWLLVVMALYIPFLLRLNDLNSRMLQFFIALLTFQLIYSSDISAGMQDVLNIATTFGIVVYFARGLKDEPVMYWLGVVTGVVAAVGGLLLLVKINETPYTNPNNWTYFPLTALFAICISLPYARKFNKSSLVLLFLALVNVGLIFLSGSRGSLLIALICVIYLFLSTRSLTLSSVMVALAILIGMWFSAAFVQQQSYTISRIQLLFDPTQSERDRTSQRSVLARAGWQIFLDNPAGIGTGSFRVVSGETSVLSHSRPAHSAWIKTLAENGVLGVLLLAGFIGSYFIAGFRKRQEGKILFGLFITFVFAAAFIAKEFRGKSLWFLAAGGIVLMHSEQVLDYLQRKFGRMDIDPRARLKEIRFGKKH